MIRRQLFDVDIVECAVYRGYARDILLVTQPVEQDYENISQNLGVVAGAVMVERRQLQVLRHGVELYTAQLRQHHAADGNGIDICVIKSESASVRGRFEESRVEARVVRDEHRLAREFIELFYRFLLRGRVSYHIVPDTGKFGYLRRYFHLRICEGIERVDYLTVLYPYRAYLGDAVVHSAKARRL